jgi:hypothetical protein
MESNDLTGAGLLRLNPQTGAWARETYRRGSTQQFKQPVVLALGRNVSGAVGWRHAKTEPLRSSRFLSAQSKGSHNPNSLSAIRYFPFAKMQRVLFGSEWKIGA